MQFEMIWRTFIARNNYKKSVQSISYSWEVKRIYVITEKWVGKRQQKKKHVGRQST